MKENMSVEYKVFFFILPHHCACCLLQWGPEGVVMTWSTHPDPRAGRECTGGAK